MAEPLSVYVHIPFCVSKCAYCDFPSWPGLQERWGAYLDAVLAQARSEAAVLGERRVITVFVGGGTPSILPEAELVRLLTGIRETFQVDPGAEITVEANPGTLTRMKLKALRAAGVNRLSFGVQAMDDRLLRRLGRIHTADTVRRSVEAARDAGFDDLNLDLMYALPGQSLSDWTDTLNAALALRPEHISAYSLILEKGTPLADSVERGEVSVPDDEASLEMQRTAQAILREHGLERYEISNYALPGRACRHNMVYWRRGDYLGLGCAAHSLIGDVRFAGPASFSEYMAGVRRTGETKLTPADQRLETLMLATRMTEGMDLGAYRARYGVDFEEAHREALERMTGAGLCEIKNGRLCLTPRGMEVQNAVVVELMED